MNIRTSSDGILGTHVTWEEFERNLTRSLNTTARFGPNKSALDIGEGNGLLSRCALIDCDWQGEGNNSLPKKVVLKMGSCLPLIALTSSLPKEQNLFRSTTAAQWEKVEQDVKDLHNTEVDAYDVLARLGDLPAIPRRFYGAAFGDGNALSGQLCMEYVGGAREMHFYEAATLEQMKQIARTLGQLQAASIRSGVGSDSIRTKDVFAEYNKNNPKKKYLRTLGPLKKLEPALIEAVEKVEPLLDVYYGATLPSTIHTQLGLPAVLVHGDVRTENILVDKDTGYLKAIIDWQCAHFGVGVEDLLRCSFFAQSAEDRRASASHLIEEMYNAFVENLGSTPAPYSLQQFHDIYSLLFPHCALYFAIHGLSVVMPAHKPKPSDDEEKTRKYAVIVDKAGGVLEDIVTFHEKNKSSKVPVVWNWTAPAKSHL